MSRRQSGPGDKRRRRRSRPTPKWVLEHKEMDEMARRRCLMVLGVLSGVMTVTEAIEKAGISRGTYYKMEERAVRAMVSSLIPGADESGQTLTATKRIGELEAKVKRLETEKRRRERLESLTKKLVGTGPMKTGKGGKKRSSSRTKGGGAVR